MFINTQDEDRHWIHKGPALVINARGLWQDIYYLRYKDDKDFYRDEGGSIVYSHFYLHSEELKMELEGERELEIIMIKTKL